MMQPLHEDLAAALKQTLADAQDQPPEVRRRVGKLIENAARGNLGDGDVLELIELMHVEEES